MSDTTIPVSDFLSNVNDQMVAAARILGRSKHRQAIFEFIYFGSKQIKTIEEIEKATKLSKVHVLNEGGKMAGLLIDKVPGGYKKKKEFAPRYKQILAMARDQKKLKKVPTKTSPRVSVKGATFKVTFPSSARAAKRISVDDISSFSKISAQSQSKVKQIKEQVIKEGFAKIIGEVGKFKDWGGEKSDLYSTRLRMNGKRVPAAIAFKGRATTGKLVPAKMGHNGDQVNRLFDEPAEVFLVVYGGQIDSSILSQMEAFAVARAIGGKKIRYGVIDGVDLGRIVAGYPAYF